MLSEKIFEAQHGNEDCMLDLIGTFRRTMQKYSYQLHYEDALNDIIVEFISLIYKIKIENFEETGEGALTNYIVQSIKHTYIKLSKKISLSHSREQCISELGLV